MLPKNNSFKGTDATLLYQQCCIMQQCCKQYSPVFTVFLVNNTTYKQVLIKSIFFHILFSPAMEIKRKENFEWANEDRQDI